MGMTLFREKVFDHVKKEILGAVLEKIEEERCGIMVDKSILKVSIEVCLRWGVEGALWLGVAWMRHGPPL
mgnify:CR=1 FL=1